MFSSLMFHWSTFYTFELPGGSTSIADEFICFEKVDVVWIWKSYSISMNPAHRLQKDMPDVIIFLFTSLVLNIV